MVEYGSRKEVCTMTTLPPVLLSAEDKESFVQKLRAEHQAAALGQLHGSPPCPHGGLCECPETKKSLSEKGLFQQAYTCPSDAKCIVLRILCPNGTYSS